MINILIDIILKRHFSQGDKVLDLISQAKDVLENIKDDIHI